VLNVLDPDYMDFRTDIKDKWEKQMPWLKGSLTESPPKG
jgi:hypothetical protein